MCGISGIIIKNSVNMLFMDNYINCFKKYLYNRGPDNSNYYIYNNKAFIHNRLSIIDLDSKSNQPFIFKNLIMVYNGEIYNHIELKEYLVNTFNAELISHSDTEILIQLFYYIGINETLKLLNGIFALCLYNKDTDEISLIRDRIGIKYCYYYDDDDFFVFASNPGSIVKTLYEINNKKWEINTNSLFSYLSSGICLTKESMFKNVYGLDTGCMLNINNNIINIIQWYKPFFNRSNENINEYIKKAILLQEIGDVGKNILYSGGIDSSILAYYSLSSKFITINFGELEFAKIILNKINVNNTLTIIPDIFLDYKIELFIDEQRKIINFTGIPIKASYIMNMTGLYIKENEPFNKILLTGIGGNELFYGHRRIKKNNNGFKNHIRDLYLYLSQIKTLDNKYKLLFDEYKNNFFNDIYKEINIPNNLPINNIPRWLEIKTFLLNDLLLNADSIYMYYSIEARVPLLDHNIFEIALSKSPDDFFYKDINNPTWDEYTINSKKHLKDILLEKIDSNLINRDKYTYDVERHKIHPLYANLCNQFIKRNIVGWNGPFTKYNSHLIGNIELWFQEFEYLLEY
jgi:asparagine synthase (glutamine-hydrolysing)